MTIRHIRIFLEVCRTMNVTRAAENLYMTQPAVSRSIHEIEQVYGVRLFERLNQRLYLTDSGRRMRAYAVHIVDTFDQMERELSDGDERGMLRIGASITLGNYELPGVVRRMKQERPSLRLQATVANVDTLKEMLLDNRLDLAMIEAPIEHRDLTGEPFSRDELVLILPPNHTLLQKDRLTLADVAACDLLLREKGSSGISFGRTRRTARYRIPAAAISRMGSSTAGTLPGMGRPVSGSKPVRFCSSRRRNPAAPKHTLRAGMKKRCFIVHSLSETGRTRRFLMQYSTFSRRCPWNRSFLPCRCICF